MMIEIALQIGNFFDTQGPRTHGPTRSKVWPGIFFKQNHLVDRRHPAMAEACFKH